MRALVVSLVPVVMFLGCFSSENPEDNADAGNGDAPVLLRASPSRGKTVGGTRVTLEGENLGEGIRVYFGDGEATGVTRISSFRMTALTPASANAGAVEVRVVDRKGRASSLPAAFTYDDSAPRITEAVLRGPPAADVISNATSARYQVEADVEVPGITEVEGAGAGILAQVGFALEASGGDTLEDFIWADAAFASDTDGDVGGDRKRDRYAGTAALPAPASGVESVSYFVAARFSLDSGATWLVTDRDGIENGVSPSQLALVRVRGPKVDRCRIQYPSAMQALAGSQTVKVYGWVWAEQVTNGDGAGAGITASVGYGPSGSQPSGAGWTWSPATFNEDKEDKSADEYEATFQAPAAGTYAYAYRFQLGANAPVYCDVDGSENGYQPAQAGVLTISSLDCSLSPLGVGQTASGEKRTVKGQVLIPGVTNAASAAPNLRGQFGVGAPGSDARSSDLWGWKDAVWSADVMGADELSADLTPAYTGARAVSFRVSRDNGSTWTYCDLDGIATNGYDVGQQAPLDVTAPNDTDYCVIQYPKTPVQQPKSGAPIFLFGQVYEAGVTDSVETSFTAEIGYGTKKEDPGVAGSWKWLPAEFNAGATSEPNNDEFQATLASIPVGVYSYVFRFKRAGSSNYCYADLNGNGANTVNTPGVGFSGENETGGENLGHITVSQ